MAEVYSEEEKRATAIREVKPSIEPGRRACILANYPDAFTDMFTDTDGTISSSPFLYKTGSRWPTPAHSPEAQPFLRQLYPVYNHPITDSWPSILEDVKAYLSDRQMPYTAITDSSPCSSPSPCAP